MKNRNVAVVVVVLKETKNLSRSKTYELWRRRGIVESEIFCLELKSYIQQSAYKIMNQSNLVPRFSRDG